MGKRSHSANEFGKAGTGGSLVGFDAPLIGAAASILVDAAVEREAGITSPPPPFSIRTAIIGLVVMFLAGVLGSILLLQHAGR